MEALKLSNVHVRRDILKKNRLSQLELDQIKKQVQADLARADAPQPDQPATVAESSVNREDVSPEILPSSHSPQLDIPTDTEIEDARNEILNAMATARHSNMSERDPLPRFQMTKKKMAKTKMTKTKIRSSSVGKSSSVGQVIFSWSGNLLLVRSSYVG